jgi:hypothetical protein
MVKRREAQSIVDLYQRFGCLEAVRRKSGATPEAVSRWCGLPMRHVMRHLHALEREGQVVRRGTMFVAGEVGGAKVRTFASIA